MKEFRLPVVLFALVVGLGAPHAPAEAELCAIDAVPAATLLLPYFEVKLDRDRSKIPVTFFSINNASEESTIAHVSFWTDMSVPTINFDVFLTGYDVQIINVTDIFYLGYDAIPRTFNSSESAALEETSTGVLHVMLTTWALSLGLMAI